MIKILLLKFVVCVRSLPFVISCFHAREELLLFVSLFIPISEPSLENHTNLTNGNAIEIRELPKAVHSRLSQTKMPGEAVSQTSGAILQNEQTASHTTPLTVHVSPEGKLKSLLSNQRNSSTNSSLLLARNDNGFFSSQSGVLPLSRRKKASRKYAFPHKVLPNSCSGFSFSDLAGKYFAHRPDLQREGAGHILNSISTSNQVGYSASCEGESVDSPGLCDSTENSITRVSMERTELMDLSVQQRQQNSDENSAAPFSTDAYSNLSLHETSSTNGSSPAVSEEHPVIMDTNSDSREMSGGENDSDSNLANCDNSPSYMVHASSHSIRNGELQEAKEEMDCSLDSTPIVVLPSTVQVKTDPNEVFETGDPSSPVQKVEQVCSQQERDNSEHQDVRQHIHSEGYSVIMPTSSAEVNSNSVALHQVSALMPHVVKVVSESPEHREQTDNAQQHFHDHCEDGRDHSCDICHKQFESAISVVRHKRSHSGDRPYICKICGWGFNLSGNLNQHLAIHQKVKPFKCVYCGKTFARSNVLKAHVRCHTGERPYQCQLCGSKFIIPHNLKKHMLTRHGIKEDDKLYSQNVDGPDNSHQKDENTSTPLVQS